MGVQTHPGDAKYFTKIIVEKIRKLGGGKVYPFVSKESGALNCTIFPGTPLKTGEGTEGEEE